jgi:heme/copper-type cytochrome/quinol oxidase subunit 2
MVSDVLFGAVVAIAALATVGLGAMALWMGSAMWSWGPMMWWGPPAQAGWWAPMVASMVATVVLLWVAAFLAWRWPRYEERPKAPQA